MNLPTPRLGTVLRDGERIGLRYVRHLAHPPERVWRAITESDQLRHWFPADIEGERKNGAELRLPFWPDHVEAYGIETPAVPGRIHIWDPPRVFEWSWDTDHLRWELAPEGSGTILTFTTWIGEPLAHGPDGSPDEATGVSRAGAGYHVCLDYLEALLDERGAGPLVEANVGALEVAYREMF